MADTVTTDFEQPAGRLILRCDTTGFERVLSAVCRERGVFVPISVPPTPVREVVIVLAANAPPPRVSWWRHVAALILCALMLAGPIGVYTLITWVLKLWPAG